MPRILLPGLAALSVSFSVAAQCQTIWSSGGPQPQLSGTAVCSTIWDPDGAGPATSRLVVGGDRLRAGSQPIDQRVLLWDGSQWEALAAGPGTGVNGQVQALTVWNGLLVAGGAFTGAGINYVALWSGSSWQPLGAGFPVGVQHLTVWNGLLVAVSQSGGVPIVRLWDGVSWTALPTPPSLMFPAAVIAYQGLLIVAGSENTPSQGVLERWNGTTWLPSIVAQTQINCLGVRPSLLVGGNDTLYAAGLFNTIGGTAATNIAATSGGSAFAWSAVGGAAGLPARCDELLVRTAGLTGTSVIAVVNSASTPVVQLSGGVFTAMGNAPLNSLVAFGGTPCGTTSQSNDGLRRWDGSQWAPVRGPGLDGPVRALCSHGADVLVGGTFTAFGGTALGRVARWNGTTFAPLGAGLTGSSVDALLDLGDGAAIAGGLFLQSGSTPLNHIARWDGSAWTALGSGMNQQVLALCRLPNGDLVAGGSFTAAGGVVCNRIARWDGSVWSPLGAGCNAEVRALAVRSDGTLFVGGAFTTAGGIACQHVAQWNGATWAQVGAGTNNDVYDLAVRPNGDLVAVGAFTSAGGLPASRCARWTGAAWTTMGATSNDPDLARAVFALPDGGIVAARGFHLPAQSPDDGIARWDGSAWSGFGSGLGGYVDSATVAVHAFALRENGDLVVGGDFSTAGDVMSYDLAVLSPTCRPTAIPYGAGCSSAAGPIALRADTLPWLGASFRTTTTGIAANTLCLGAIGFTQLAIPWSSLLVEGQAGCSLLAAPDLTFVLQNGPGTAHSSLALANSPSLLGAAFYQQTIPLEFDGAGVLLAVRGSNALAATIGTL